MWCIWVVAGLYYMILNIYGYACMWLDKRKARQTRRRIPERRLFGIAWLGGSFGIWAGMRRFRHKTLHAQFVWGIPLLCLLHAGLMILVIRTFSL